MPPKVFHSVFNLFRNDFTLLFAKVKSVRQRFLAMVTVKALLSAEISTCASTS
jgi:hypothetical protein